MAEASSDWFHGFLIITSIHIRTSRVSCSVHSLGILDYHLEGQQTTKPGITHPLPTIDSPQQVHPRFQRLESPLLSNYSGSNGHNFSGEYYSRFVTTETTARAAKPTRRPANTSLPSAHGTNTPAPPPQTQPSVPSYK
ncbi:hypothetical protein HGRIS_001128 [Hohenbuehelia grisea]|uniref:Uncharacterized protein n=1 Tax=Hohenbuehelia grisea TaxID=104357 RepID=A0ABR3JNC1_9AGAR